MGITNAQIEPIKVILKEALLNEWKAQGHYINGKIVEEMDFLIERDLGRTAIIGKMYAYGVYQDAGVQAANIPFSPGSGAKRSRYIDGLVRFVQQRMAVSTLKEAKSIAFAIAHTQKREGMPTGGSFQYSSTGKRTEWVSDAILKAQPKLGAYIRQFYTQYMRTEFESVITKHIKQL
jgi:hypothetical protein